MAAPGMIVVKSFTYRGVAEEWSNVYHLYGTAPSTPSDWRAMADGLIAEEKTLYAANVTVERVLCYGNTDDPAVYVYLLADFSGVVSGTFSPTSGTHEGQGDGATWVRWATGVLNSKGKPIYLRKYFHNVWTTTNGDTLDSALVTALQAFGTALLSALTGGYQIGMPNGDLPAGPAAPSLYATTRTLKRRGKRP